jgi:hypothetical protein
MLVPTSYSPISLRLPCEGVIEVGRWSVQQCSVRTSVRFLLSRGVANYTVVALVYTRKGTSSEDRRLKSRMEQS